MHQPLFAEEYEGGLLRDPFRSLLSKDPETSRVSQPSGLRVHKYMLQGLVWNTSKPQAVINDQVVGVGDTIDSAQVTRIDKEGVTLTKDNQKIMLSPDSL